MNPQIFLIERKKHLESVFRISTDQREALVLLVESMRLSLCMLNISPFLLKKKKVRRPIKKFEIR